MQSRLQQFVWRRVNSRSLYHPNTMQQTSESDTHFSLNQSEIDGVHNRISEYKNEVLDADIVVIALGCSDSRVVVPQIQRKTEMCDDSIKKVMYISVPTIGGGLPSRSRLRGVINTLLKWGVEGKKLRILVIPHGSTEEIHLSKHLDTDTTDADIETTCGLRTALKKYEPEFLAIRKVLLPWTLRLKQEENDKTLAPDRMTLEELEAKCPQVMKLVLELHEKSGLPRRFIIRTAYRNADFRITANEMAVFTAVCGYLTDEYPELFATCLVAMAKYDHNRKELDFDIPETDLGMKDKVISLGLPTRHDTVQKPNDVIISFGHEAICLHNGALLPSEADSMVKPDNAFRCCASILTVPTALVAFVEGFYAVDHFVHPHHGDENFSTLQKVIIVCDTQAHVDVIKAAVRSREFLEDCQPVYAQLNHGIMLVLNLNLDKQNPQAVYEELSVA